MVKTYIVHMFKMAFVTTGPIQDETVNEYGVLTKSSIFLTSETCGK